MSKVVKFKDKAQKLLGKLEDHINKMPEKGNSSSDCQRTYLQQQINEVSYAINGIVEDDLKVDDE
jgi:ArsR family metal-binding transcriptional regulator